MDSIDRNPNKLTPRQREICFLLAEGKSNQEIADQLGLSIRTVESHISFAMAILDYNRVQLAICFDRLIRN